MIVDLLINLKRYIIAVNLMAEGKYEDAKEEFLSVGQFKNAIALLKQCDNMLKYENAMKILEEKDYIAAKEAFSILDGIEQDFKEQTKQEEDFRSTKYRMANIALADKKFYTAYQLFTELKDYMDSTEQVTKCIQPYPATMVLYRNSNYNHNYAPLIIHSAKGEPTYLKIYAAEGPLVVTLFLNSGQTLNVEMPRGNFIVKEAHGNLWFGEEEMFGDLGSYRLLDTGLIFNTFGEGYEATLDTQEEGNLGSIPVEKENF
jgi:hypothetical protein